MASSGEHVDAGERALALERSGRWNGADQLYAQLFRSAIEAGDLPMAVDAVRGQARIRHRQKHYVHAEELAELSREIAERNSLVRGAARALNTLAVIRYLQQDWNGARKLYEAAFDRALDIGDDELIGWACQNMGIIANILGDFSEARTRYLESMGAAVRSGNKTSEAVAYNNLGMVCADLGDWMEAELYFDRGIEIAQRIGTVPLLAKLYANRAEPLIRTGELDQARDTLDQAEEAARRVSDQSTLADVARFRGVIARRTGDLDSAERYLADSLSLTGEKELSLERAQALEELAHVRRSQGQMEEAFSTLDGARAAFQSLGAEWDAARVEELMGRWEPGMAARHGVDGM